MPVLEHLPLAPAVSMLHAGLLTVLLLDPIAIRTVAIRHGSSDVERPAHGAVHAAPTAKHQQDHLDLAAALVGATRSIGAQAPAPTPAAVPSTPAEAAVFAEDAEYPEQMAQAVELLRFVTAYGTGIEAVVDLTPYSPLLRAASEEGNLTLYNFIDTWVGNDTGSDIVYLSNTTGKCYPAVQYYGNGWGLNAELLFWPSPATVQVDTRPHASVTLASGYYGSTYGIGGISTHEGSLLDSGKAVELHDTVDLAGVKSATVYSCEDQNEVQHNALLGYLAQEARNAAASGNEKLSKGVKYLAQDIFEMLAVEQLGFITLTEKGADNLTANASYDRDVLSVEIGTPVYFNMGEVFSDLKLDLEDGGTTKEFWVNSTTPFTPVGNVTAVKDGKMTISFNVTCLPGNSTHNMPDFVVPRTREAVEQVRAMVRQAEKIGADHGAQELNQTLPSGVSTTSFFERGRKARGVLIETGGPPLLLKPKADAADELIPVTELGQVDLASLPSGSSQIQLMQAVAAPAAASHSSSSSKQHRHKAAKKKESVCVVAQRRQGRLFDRSFSLPTLQTDDRVLLQLAVTGHGWSATTEQCGEYCHAVYQISFNGTKALNITQWRDDCKVNPTGSMQHGTWTESRNGWCPGSVEPGLFVDVTDWVQSGDNLAAVDLSVWSSVLESYEPYTDYGGFAVGDAASLSVGLSLFVYSGAAAAAIIAQPRAYTAAEAALRIGSSVPSALQPPARPTPAVPPALVQAEQQQSDNIGSAATGDARGIFDVAQHREVSRPRARRRMQAQLLARGFSAVSRGATQAAAKPSRQKHTERSHRLRGEHARRESEETRFDFEKRAPWYFFNSTSEPITELLNPVRVPIFTDSLVQSNTRILAVNISKQLLPEAWGQVGLRLHLTKPPGELETDHWDRECSLGLLLPHPRKESSLFGGETIISTVALHHQKQEKLEVKSVPLSHV